MILVGTLLTGLALAVPAPSASSALALPSFSASDIDSGRAIQDLSKLAYDTAMARVAKATTGCTKDKVKIRKEWCVTVYTDSKEADGAGTNRRDAVK